MSTRGGIEVTEVLVKVPVERDPGKVVCYANLVLNGGLAVHDVRLLRQDGGRLVVAMPNRPVWGGRCPRCAGKAAWNDSYCRRCGERLLPFEPEGKRFVDLCHPIDGPARHAIDAAVVGSAKLAGLLDAAPPPPSPPLSLAARLRAGEVA